MIGRWRLCKGNHRAIILTSLARTSNGFMVVVIELVDVVG
jgi:hypothetical protein